MPEKAIASDPSYHGSAHPLGSTVHPDGVNFSLFSKHATAVELLLFDQEDDLEPVRVVTFDKKRNKSYHYWHVFVPGLQSGQLYGYRVFGPFDPAAGHRFDSSKVLLDPYARAVAIPRGYKRKEACKPGRLSCPSMKSVVADLSHYDWEGDKRLERPFAHTMIYEMHVRGFTRHPSSGLSEDLRGSYAGLIEKIPYLQELGITAVELLPVFQFDAQDCPPGKVNYWGYSPMSFFAVHSAYSRSGRPLEAINEFRDMVKALHRAGIEVILDVVFNHSAEGDGQGPTFCFKGIDNSVYYILEQDRSYYSNFSGTGNTLNANQPIVRRMIIDSLHFWVEEMHVDGFRFDLASILARDQRGQIMENPPVLWDIESDPVLAGVKLIAEAWDAAGLYQVGQFVGDSWREWNGKFRDDVRSFLKGDLGMLSKLTSRLIASPDIYAHKNREPELSVNFVTCHDGFTLNDLVSYNMKHNEANGEKNRDGDSHNLSWNCGVEGPTEQKEVESLRNRQVKNFLALTVISLGVPMILMGDEVRRTQQGNNNAYCHDNELTWFDWSLTQKHADVLRFTKKVLAMRSRRSTVRENPFSSLSELLNHPLITWHGINLYSPDWSYHSRTIAFTVESLNGQTFMHYMLNAFGEPLDFELPNPSAAQNTSWRLWIDTALDSPRDICDWDEAPNYEKRHYPVQPFSMAILYCKAKT